MNNASQLLNEVGQGRFKCCKPWPNAEDDNTSCAVSSRGCLNAPPLLETFTAAPKKFLKKLTSTIALEWPNSATNLSVNCQIEIGIVRNQTDILTRITPCYRQEEWHEQCECYHYGIRSGKKLKFRDRSLVDRATSGSNQSERRKDNGGIVFWVTCVISIGHAINLFTWPISTNQKAASPTAPQVPGSERTARPEVNKNTLFLCQNHIFCLMECPKVPFYIRDMCDILVTSRPWIGLQI